MQDKPSTIELIEAVADFIRERAMPELTGRTAFHARVAANALDIVKRALEVAPEAEAEELARLKELLATDGTLEELNRALSSKIESGEIDLSTPGLSEHLWATTLTKLAIDQPKYSAYRQATREKE